MTDMDVLNKKAYENHHIVKGYEIQKALAKPEQTILDVLKNNLPAMKMLDIGVGAGRTAAHFGPLVQEYVGVDYSEHMIKACQANAGLQDPKMSFMVCDARAMGMFKDNAFDFILFSFNGIDYMPHEDRAKTLHEIKRVGKSGAFFCFSTHNVLCIEKYLKL